MSQSACHWPCTPTPASIYLLAVNSYHYHHRLWHNTSRPQPVGLILFAFRMTFSIKALISIIFALRRWNFFGFVNPTTYWQIYEYLRRLILYRSRLIIMSQNKLDGSNGSLYKLKVDLQYFALWELREENRSETLTPTYLTRWNIGGDQNTV